MEKRMANLAILEILKKETDVDHRLKQAEILRLLYERYGIEVTRKTVSMILHDLQAFGYPVEYRSGWFYSHEFSPAELNLLVAGVMFNPSLTYAQRREIAGKLRNLGKPTPASRMAFDINSAANPQFMFNMELVQEAIDAQRKIEFAYARFDVDKKLHPRLDDDGATHAYIVNPYRIVLANSRYYLICNVDKYDAITHFRMDRILDCRLLSDVIKPMRDVHGLEYGLNIPEYMVGHVHMFTGDVSTARIRVSRKLVSDVLDWFGMDVRFENITEDTADAVIRTDEGSLTYWLKRYTDAERLPD